MALSTFRTTGPRKLYVFIGVCSCVCAYIHIYIYLSTLADFLKGVAKGRVSIICGYILKLQDLHIWGSEKKRQEKQKGNTIIGKLCQQPTNDH